MKLDVSNLADGRTMTKTNFYYCDTNSRVASSPLTWPFLTKVGTHLSSFDFLSFNFGHYVTRTCFRATRPRPLLYVFLSAKCIINLIDRQIPLALAINITTSLTSHVTSSRSYSSPSIYSAPTPVISGHGSHQAQHRWSEFVTSNGVHLRRDVRPFRRPAHLLRRVPTPLGASDDAYVRKARYTEADTTALTSAHDADDVHAHTGHARGRNLLDVYFCSDG